MDSITYSLYLMTHSPIHSFIHNYSSVFISSNVHLFIYSKSHTHIHSFIHPLINFKHLIIHSFIHVFTYLFLLLILINSLIHSPFHSLFPSYTHCLLYALPPLSPSLTTYMCSSLFPSTASFQEAEPPSRLGPLVLTPRTFSSILTSSLLNCAGMCPGVQRIRFPLRNRCSCNHCFDFHPLMPENSTNSSSMQEGIHSAGAGPAVPGGSDSRI